MPAVRKLVPILLLISASAAMAQQSSHLDADKIVAEAVEAHRAMKVFAVSYAHTLNDGTNAMTEPAQAWFSRDRFRIRYPEMEYFDNGRYIWVHHMDVQRVFVYDAAPNTFWDIDRVFWYDWTRGETKDLVAESDAWRVTVQVNNDDLYRADLWIGLDDHRIQRAILYDSEGRRHSFEVSEYEERKRIPFWIFAFNERRNPDALILPLTAEPYEGY